MEDADEGQKTWEMSNGIATVTHSDGMYKYDDAEQKRQMATRAWKSEYVINDVGFAVLMRRKVLVDYAVVLKWRVA
jgi:hypothetical protein